LATNYLITFEKFVGWKTICKMNWGNSLGQLIDHILERNWLSWLWSFFWYFGLGYNYL